MMGLFVFGFYRRVLERKIARGSTARAEVRALPPWLLPSKHAESKHRVASRTIRALGALVIHASSCHVRFTAVKLRASISARADILPNGSRFLLSLRCRPDEYLEPSVSARRQHSLIAMQFPARRACLHPVSFLSPRKPRWRRRTKYRCLAKILR